MARDVGFNAFAVGRVIPYYVALSASALCLGVFAAFWGFVLQPVVEIASF